MNSAVRRRLDLEQALRHAIDERELRVYYQPVMSLATGRITEVEALVRWARPHGRLMEPDDFIPLAEETGLILPIGRWVLEEACRQVRAWRTENPAAASLKLSVNFSARQLQSPRLVHELGEILRKTRLEPAALKVEIAEDVMMRDAEATMPTLRRLKELGVQLVVDDFGAGRSSLADLKRFPLDLLKIDRSFVDQLGVDADTTAIVRAIVGLAGALNLDVAAEGIETADQLACLQSLGCARGQGFYFARPLHAAALQALLAEGRLGAAACPAA